MIYSMSTSDKLLACLLQNPLLVLDNNYKLEKEEFEPCMLHKICYVVIYNLACNNYNNITPMDFDQYLMNYEAQYNIFLDNNGIDYLNTICELTDTDNLKAYYQEFKKLSCLRAYKDNGFNIKEFWDEEISDEKNIENINQYTLEDIINYFEGLQINIRKYYYPKERDIEENQAGFGLEELKEKLQEEPLYGNSFCSELMNTITRGAMDGQLTCISSPSGVGKSTNSVATLCKVCATKLWDYETNQFIDNPTRTKNGGLYIQFELDNVQELSVKFLAYISGVPSNKILDGKYTQEENYRIDTAIDILKDSNIHLSYMPSFTKKSIEESIKSHILDYGIDFLVYDYIQDGSSLNGEMNRDNGGIGLRTDQVLANLSDFLKLMARTYNIPIYTSTQTNAQLGSNEIIGVESISGSRAVANKLDIGGVFLPLRPKEIKARDIIEGELGERGFGLPHATHCYHMYKVRFGSYPQNIKIWVNLDLGTGRMKDCFCTDWQNKLIKVPKTKLERKD